MTFLKKIFLSKKLQEDDEKIGIAIVGLIVVVVVFIVALVIMF